MRPLSFTIELVGAGCGIRVPGTTTDLVRLNGGFFLTLDPTTIQIYETGRALVRRRRRADHLRPVDGPDHRQDRPRRPHPGRRRDALHRRSRRTSASRASAASSASPEPSPSCSTRRSRIRSSRSRTRSCRCCTRATRRRSRSTARRPGLDGQRRANAPPGGEIYVVATIQADITIGGVITLNGFIQIEAAVEPDDRPAAATSPARSARRSRSSARSPARST